MRTVFSLSLELNSLGKSDILRLFNFFLLFQPEEITLSPDTYLWSEDTLSKILDDYNGLAFLNVSNKDGNSLSMGQAQTKVCHLHFEAILDKRFFKFSDENLYNLFCSWPFSVAVVYDYYYCAVQTEKYQSNLELLGLSQIYWETIQHTPTVEDDFGDEAYDVSKNPGRLQMLNNSFYTPGSKIWLGRSFETSIRRSQLLECLINSGVRPTVHANNIVYIKLFEKPEDAILEKNIVAQRQLNSCLGLS